MHKMTIYSRFRDMAERCPGATAVIDFMIPEFFVKMAHRPILRRVKVDIGSLPALMKEGGVE